MRRQWYGLRVSAAALAVVGLSLALPAGAHAFEVWLVDQSTDQNIES